MSNFVERNVIAWDSASSCLHPGGTMTKNVKRPSKNSTQKEATLHLDAPELATVLIGLDELLKEHKKGSTPEEAPDSKQVNGVPVLSVKATKDLHGKFDVMLQALLIHDYRQEAKRGATKRRMASDNKRSAQLLEESNRD
jgi:hypothetical protein